MSNFDFEAFKKFSKDLSKLIEAHDLLFNLWLMISPYYGSRIDGKLIDENIINRLRKYFDFDDGE